MQTADYCREIETYLCRKNDGHLIRVVGPSFDLVSGWATQGIPLKVAFRGIDRYFERYYRKGRRRRPVRIDFCEADVLDVFDEWRRALGLSAAGVVEPAEPERRGRSLIVHLERVLLRLSEGRASGLLDARCDDVIDRVARELDHARVASRGLRGSARRALLERLSGLDVELVRLLVDSLGEGGRAALARDAEAELAAYRTAMPVEGFARARDAAVERLVRERFRLPTIKLG